MKLKSKIAILAVNSVLCVLVALATYFFMSGWSVFVQVVCYGVAGLGFLFSFITFFIKKDALFKSAFVIVVCAAVIVGAIAFLSGISGFDSSTTDGEKIDRLVQLINGYGGWGLAIYFLIQVLQVVILPLPAVVCYVPGSIIFGPLKATLVASAGVLVGSVIAYFIGRFFGKRAVVWIAGKENTEKYTSYLSRRGKVLFVLMQILPFFPDDILCMVVGLSGMNFLFFTVTIVLVRPIVIATYCYLGSGTIIPFEGWGIAVWIIIFAVCIVLAVLSFKYQDKIEKWLVEKFARKKVVGKGAETEGEEQPQPAASEELQSEVTADGDEQTAASEELQNRINSDSTGEAPAPESAQGQLPKNNVEDKKNEKT